MTEHPTDACLNTDRELWRETEGDYYASSIHVTAQGRIGINVGGLVIYEPLAVWHDLAMEAAKPSTPIDERLVEKAFMEGRRFGVQRGGGNNPYTAEQDWLTSKSRAAIEAIRHVS